VTAFNDTVLRIRSVSLATRMIAASIILAVLVAAVFVVLIQAVSALNDATQRELRSRDLRAATFELEKLVVDLETGARGFVLTSDPGFRNELLQPWRQAQAELPRHLTEFERLASTSSSQERLARNIGTLIRSYAQGWSTSLVRLARENPGVARTTEATAEGQRQTDGIRDRIDRFITAEDAEAAATRRAADRRYDRAIRLAIGALVASTLLVILFGLYLTRWLARPVRDAANAAGRVAEGDLSVRLEEDGPGEVGELEASFNRMAGQLERGRDVLQEQNAQLRESERLKSELVSIVSHELRTPLASVLGFTALLLTRDLEPEEQRRYLEIIDSQGRRLSSLLNDFLDVERLEEGQLELARELMDIKTVVRDQTRLFAGQSSKHKLDVELPAEPLIVRGDPNRLAQVVANLLSNAIKYSPDGGIVKVVGQQNRDVVRVSVRDEGMGIPDELQQRVFAKFFRGNAGASGIQGSGLGLTIARSVVEAHGGRISFESATGKGSVFWLELPIAASVDDAAA
jgi:signal transduction histidine kinase